MIMTLQVRVADEGEPGVEPQGGPAADPGAETEHRAPSRRQGNTFLCGRGPGRFKMQSNANMTLVYIKNQ